MRDNPHQILMEQAFAKVSARLQEYDDGVISKSHCSKNLAQFITKNTGHAISEAAIEAYWDTVESGISFHIPEIEVLNGLAMYLDFPNYETWYVAQEVKDQREVSDPRRKWLIVLIIAMVVILSFLVYQLLSA